MRFLPYFFGWMEEKLRPLLKLRLADIRKAN